MRSLDFPSFFTGLGNFLFEPGAQVPSSLRRQSRLLASLLLISLLILGLNLRFENFPAPGSRESLLLGAIPLVLAYALSRFGYFPYALAIAMLDLVAIVVAVSLVFAPYRDFQPALALVWLVIPVFMGSIFLSFAASIFVVLGAMTPFFVFIPLLTPGAYYGWLLALIFYVSVSCLILIWSRNRGIQERERLAELSEHSRRLEQAIVQKDASIREVHHRVKNNLQLISSLLFLQTKRSSENPAPFLELQTRIKTMSQVYERLYRADEVSRIGLADYLEELVRGMISSYAPPGIEFLGRGLDRTIFLDPDAAVSVGLIVTELVTNSLKHGFSEGRGGTILLEFERGERGLESLIVGDDGSGMEDSAAGRRGMGMQIVHALAKQLDATVERQGERGTVFRIRFGLPSPERKA